LIQDIINIFSAERAEKLIQDIIKARAAFQFQEVPVADTGSAIADTGSAAAMADTGSAPPEIALPITQVFESLIDWLNALTACALLRWP
jgi:hypothetical protein